MITRCSAATDSRRYLGTETIPRSVVPSKYSQPSTHTLGNSGISVLRGKFCRGPPASEPITKPHVDPKLGTNVSDSVTTGNTLATVFATAEKHCS